MPCSYFLEKNQDRIRADRFSCESKGSRRLRKGARVKNGYFSIATAMGLATLAIGAAFHYHRTPLPNDACSVARLHLNQASKSSNAYLYSDAYDAAVLGLKADRTCRDEDAKVVNEGFLLSTKAIAEHFLSRGDSANDLNRAIDLLKRCREIAPKLGSAISDLCEKQHQSDIQTQARFSK